MADLNTQQLQEYLKQVSDLEVSVYQQARTKEEAESSLEPPKLKYTPPPKPKRVSSRISEPTKPQGGCSGSGWGWVYFGAFVIMVGAIASIVYLEYSHIITLGLVLCAFGIITYFVSQKMAEKEYQESLREYAIKRKELEKVREKEMEKWAEKEKEANKAHALKVQQAKKKYENAVAAVDMLNAPLKKSEELLKDLYDMDVIFPKYRNMVAMCTMYEYFVSGRCSELAGPNGAYNLYEAEVRQNLIINQLDKINANLDQVRQNQYYLYQGIVETNRIMGEVSEEVKRIATATQDIAETSAITAYCAKITAANTEAIKAIDFFKE